MNEIGHEICKKVKENVELDWVIEEVTFNSFKKTQAVLNVTAILEYEQDLILATDILIEKKSSNNDKLTTVLIEKVKALIADDWATVDEHLAD